MVQTSKRRLTVLLLATIMIAAACSPGGDDSGATDAEEAFTTSQQDEGRSDSDGEGGLFDEAGGEEGGDSQTEMTVASTAPEEAEQAMDDEAMEEEVQSDTASALTTGDTGAPSATSPDGFFVEDGGTRSDSSGEDADAELARENGNTFQDYGVRSFVDTDRDPLSTFALDVDTASYSIARQWLSEGVVPPAESVRVEEFVNSFDYDYAVPRDGLTILAEAGPSPFDDNNIILRLGVQAEEVSNRDRPDASLTFVIDTSGSMDRDDRLGLVKSSLTVLVEELDRNDSVAIVTYSGDADIILHPTSVRDRDTILDAIDSLRPNGSTNLEAGLRAGYDMANEGFLRDGINRVILASDGVANVGLTDPDGLVELIRDDADEGIQLVTIGVGMGNFNDVVMETLADDGDGFYAYVNAPAEAEKLFSEDLVSTLLTVAIDAKIQVEFDEDIVRSYRLLGFENRAVLDDDFRNDAVDAGELGAGHQVTALYELELWDDAGSRDRLGTAALRWEDPESGEVIENRLEISGAILEDSWSDTTEDFRLAVTVGAFAELLRGSQYAQDITFEQVAQEADSLARGSADIQELVDLIEHAGRHL